MGDVAVLHPQNCLKGPFSKETLILSPHRKPPFKNPNPNPNSNSNRTNRRKKSPTGTREKIHGRSPLPKTMVAKIPAKNLVMGQVKILKRGEDLTQTTSDRASDVEKNRDGVDPVLSSTDRLGPDPNTLSKKIRSDELNRVGLFYAGSALIASPPPSSLPLPGFCTKNSVPEKNEDAESYLRRILRLDFL